MNAAAKPKLINFPEREPRVVVGDHISATNQRILARMTIGTYEMSVAQQENGNDSTRAVKAALHGLSREGAGTYEQIKSRDFICVASLTNSERAITVWITTPLEPTQSGHLCWARFKELGGEERLGIAYKLANAFTANDILTVVKNAEKALRVVAAGEAYVLSGNPPPRFAKKSAAAPAEPVEPVAT